MIDNRVLFLTGSVLPVRIQSLCHLRPIFSCVLGCLSRPAVVLPFFEHVGWLSSVCLSGCIVPQVSIFITSLFFIPWFSQHLLHVHFQALVVGASVTITEYSFHFIPPLVCTSFMFTSCMILNSIRVPKVCLPWGCGLASTTGVFPMHL